MKPTCTVGVASCMVTYPCRRRPSHSWHQWQCPHHRMLWPRITDSLPWPRTAQPLPRLPLPFRLPEKGANPPNERPAAMMRLPCREGNVLFDGTTAEPTMNSNKKLRLISFNLWSSHPCGGSDSTTAGRLLLRESQLDCTCLLRLARCCAFWLPPSDCGGTTAISPSGVTHFPEGKQLFKPKQMKIGFRPLSDYFFWLIPSYGVNEESHRGKKSMFTNKLKNN